MPALSTKDRLVDVAHGLFYRDGFHTVGLDRILGEVGVTKTTFYNHFQSKEDLMLEVLNHHDKWWRDTFRTKLREMGGDTPRGQLMAVFDVVDELINSPDYNGCIFVNVAVEFPLPHDPIHQAAAEHKRKMEDILRELAGYAGASDAAMLAKEMAMLMEGAYVTQHISRSEQTAAIAREIGKILIDRYVPNGGK